MENILYKYDDEGQLLLVFELSSNNDLSIFFNGIEFGCISRSSIPEINTYDELKYRAKNKNSLTLLEIRHFDYRIFYVKMSNDDLFEIKYTFKGQENISQSLYILSKKNIKHYDRYDYLVLEGFEKAQPMTLLNW